MFPVPNQMPTGSSNPLSTTPIFCKILILINVAIWVSTLIFTSLMNGVCLSPYRVLNHFDIAYQTLWTANFFHSNPMFSGPMGIFHILLNMMTLYSVGSFLERKLGSFGFAGMSLFFIVFVGPMQIPIALFTNFITQGKIGLLSLNQCGIGYSGMCTFLLVVFLFLFLLYFTLLLTVCFFHVCCFFFAFLLSMFLQSWQKFGV